MSATSIPRSPRTRVWRTLVGEIQLITQLNDCPPVSCPVNQDGILVGAAHSVLRLGGKPGDRRAAEPADEVEVVDAEVLDDADIADARRVGADPLRGDEKTFPRSPVCIAARRAINEGLKRST